MESIEEGWRVVGPSGLVPTCAVYRPRGLGVEVRAGYWVDHFQCARCVAHVAEADVIADTWLGALVSLGYTELAV
jgi:hypothetical protein